MKIDAPLISISTAVPESSELSTQNQTVTPGGDFSALLFLLAAPQNVLPVTEAAAQPIGPSNVDSLASGRLPLAAPPPALQRAPAGAGDDEAIRAVPSLPAIFNLLGDNAAHPIVGVPAELVKEISSSIPSRPSQAMRGALFPLQAAEQRSADRQMIEPENGATSKPSGTASIAVPPGNSPANDETTAGRPVLTDNDGEKSHPAIRAAVIMPNGEQTPTQSVRKADLPISPVRTAESNSESSPTLPGNQLSPKDAQPAASANTSAKPPVPETSASAPFTVQLIESSVPIVASTGTPPAMKPDALETRATDSDDGATISQSAPTDASHPLATIQQTAADDHQELPSGALPVNGKPAENSPKDHQEISVAAQNLAAARTLNAELNGAGNTLSAASPAPVLHQVAGAIAASIRNKRHEAIMTLDPPELGNLKIGLSVDGDQVRVHILAETRESHELLEKHLPELKQALRAQQLNIVDVRVESGRMGDFLTGDPRQGFQQPSPERQPWHGHLAGPAGAEITPVDPRQITAVGAEAGRVSMWA